MRAATKGMTPPCGIETSPERRELHAVRLVVEDDTNGVRVHITRDKRTLIGTDPSVDFQLSDETVSRIHCEVEVSGGGVRVKDLGSRNGTLIYDVSADSVRIDGDVVLQLGKTRVKLELLDEDGESLRPAAPLLRADPSMQLREARGEWEQAFLRSYLGGLLRRCDDNVSEAARRAGIDRVHMHRLLKRCGLR